MSAEITPLEPAAPVVVATDFSTSADAGEAWASALAAALDAPLRLVHATIEAESLGDYLGVADETLDGLEARARSRLDADVRRLRAAGIDAAWTMERGTPSTVIADVASRLAARLIVIGTRGRRGLGHLLLGSTAERVAQHAASPVLSVHSEDQAPAWPPRRTLMATDFSRESEDALRALISLWGGGPPTMLYLLHACHVPYDLGSESPCGSVTDGSELRRGIVDDVETRLHDFAAAAGSLGFPTETVFCEGHPEDLVVQRARELDVDLIVLGTRGRSGLAHVLLGSTAERVIQMAPCPVLSSRSRP